MTLEEMKKMQKILDDAALNPKQIEQIIKDLIGSNKDDKTSDDTRHTG